MSGASLQRKREVRAGLDASVLRALSAFGALTALAVIVFAGTAAVLRPGSMEGGNFWSEIALAAFLASVAYAALSGKILARHANAATMLTQVAFLAFLTLGPIAFKTAPQSDYGMILIVIMSFIYLSWPWAIATGVLSFGAVLAGEIASGVPPSMGWVFLLASVVSGSLIIHHQRNSTSKRVESLRLDLERRNADLVASEATLTEAHEIAHLAGWERDVSESTISLSSQFSRVAGFSAGPMMTTKEFIFHVHPDDRAEFLAKMTEGIANGVPFAHDFRVLTSSGTTRWLVSRVKILGDDGTPKRCVGTIQDITDRKTTEIALRDREALLGETQRVARIGSWTWDLPTGKMVWSATHFAIFQRPSEHGEPTFEEALRMLAPESAARLDAAVKAAISTGRSYEEDVELRPPEGPIVWMTCRGEAVLDASGKVVALRGTAQDITARKLAELEVVRRARFQVALQKVGEVALTVPSITPLLQSAVESVALTLDAPFAKILELDPGGRTLTLRAAVGFSKELIDHATVGTNEQSQAGFTLLRSQPVVVDDIATEMRFRDSKLLHDQGMRSGMSVAIQTHGGPYGVIGVHTNVPRRFDAAEVDFLQGVAALVSTTIVRNRAEAALRRSEQLASLGTLVAGVAHEINNPLMYIHGSIELIHRSLAGLAPGLDARQTLLVDAIKSDSDTAIRGLDRIGLITKGLRQVARATGGPRTRESLNAIVADILPIAKPRMGANVQIETQFSSALEVECNATEISQVMLNLLFNAADAMGEQGGRVRVTTRDVRGFVFIDVEDAGVGIPDPKRHQIFTPFYTTKANGTGLGLSVSHAIVAEHGGELTFESAVGVGTTFHVSLPASAPIPKLVTA